MADNSYYGRRTQPPPSNPQVLTSSSGAVGSPPGGGGADTSQSQEGRIFVGGLSWQTTDESLRWHFEQFGPVATVELMKDRNTGQPRGFGFVVFTKASTVDLVLQTPIHEINHKVVDVKRAQARGVAPPSIHQKTGVNANYNAAAAGGSSPAAGNEDSGTGPAESTSGQAAIEYNKVFVGGLPHEIDRDALKDIFSEFGPVMDTIVMIDQTTGRSRGFGFVSFENGSLGAEKAVEAQPLTILNKRVEVKFATPRDAQAKKRVLPAVSKHLGLRAGQSYSSSGEFAGLAVAYGRSGWKAGYGSKAFGAAGWRVHGWDQGGTPPERSGFSFSIIRTRESTAVEPPTKRAKR